MRDCASAAVGAAGAGRPPRRVLSSCSSRWARPCHSLSASTSRFSASSSELDCEKAGVPPRRRITAPASTARIRMMASLRFTGRSRGRPRRSSAAAPNAIRSEVDDHGRVEVTGIDVEADGLALFLAADDGRGGDLVGAREELDRVPDGAVLAMELEGSAGAAGGHGDELEVLGDVIGIELVLVAVGVDALELDGFDEGEGDATGADEDAGAGEGALAAEVAGHLGGGVGDGIGFVGDGQGAEAVAVDDGGAEDRLEGPVASDVAGLEDDREG